MENVPEKTSEPFRSVPAPIHKIFIEAIESFTESFIFFENVFLYAFHFAFIFFRGWFFFTSELLNELSNLKPTNPFNFVTLIKELSWNRLMSDIKEIIL